MIKYKNKNKQYAKKLTPRNLYPSLRSSYRLNRSMNKSTHNYFNIRCESYDFIQITSGTNITTFTYGGFNYINIKDILSGTAAWAEYATGFTYFKINRVDLVHCKCLADTTMDAAIGINSGALTMHYRLYSSRTSTDMGTKVLDSDRSKFVYPFEFGKRMTLPFEKVDSTGLNSPWKNWALVSSVGSIPGQISINDMNTYTIISTAKPYVCKFIFYVTFKDSIV